MSGEATGLFPEKGTLDRLDKAASRLIFHRVLPASLEVLVTIPGAWFGCPVYAVGLTPVILSATTAQSGRYQAVVACLAASGLAAWLRLQQLRCLEKAYTALRAPWLVLLANGAMALASCGADVGAEAVALYMCSWHVVQLSIEVLKGIFWRLRPVHALKGELQSVPRTVKELTAVVRQASQANLSFPSGDAAGSAVFACSMVVRAGVHPGLAAALVAVTGFARVYFHCHHLFDVFVGQAIGFGVTVAFSNLHFGWGHLLACQLMLGGLWKPVQRLKPKGSKKQELDVDKAVDLDS